MTLSTSRLYQKGSPPGPLMLTLVVIAASLGLSACSTTTFSTAPSNISATAQAKAQIQRIAILEIPEPRYYALQRTTLVPASQTVSTASILAGAALANTQGGKYKKEGITLAIGGAALGLLENHRSDEAYNKFTEALQPHHPDMSKNFLDQLEKSLVAKGYAVTRVPPPPIDPAQKNYDLNQVHGPYDAILVPYLNGGYDAMAGFLTPRVSAAVYMVAKPSNTLIFSQNYRYSYSAQNIGFSTHVPADFKYLGASVPHLFSMAPNAAEALRVGAKNIAERAVADF